MELTDSQREIIDQAVELLHPYCKEVSVSNTTCYFTIGSEDGDNIGEDCCDDDECVRLQKKEIRKSIPKNSRLYEHYYHNDGDHDRYDICSICGKHLNEYLSYLESELNHHSEHSVSSYDLKSDHIAFEVSGIFESSKWSVDNPKYFDTEKLINYAKHVITVLNG